MSTLQALRAVLIAALLIVAGYNTPDRYTWLYWAVVALWVMLIVDFTEEKAP